jgi:hypothetical protein
MASFHPLSNANSAHTSIFQISVYDFSMSSSTFHCLSFYYWSNLLSCYKLVPMLHKLLNVTPILTYVIVLHTISTHLLIVERVTF